MGKSKIIVMKTHCDIANENINWFKFYGKHFANVK